MAVVGIMPTKQKYPTEGYPAVTSAVIENTTSFQKCTDSVCSFFFFLIIAFLLIEKQNKCK